MSAAVTIELGPKARKILASVDRMPRTMLAAMRKEMDVQNGYTVGQIVRAHMSGRGPNSLGVVSGKLRKSVHWNPAKIIGDAIDSGIGSNLVYLAPHEFGSNATGTCQVRGYARRLPSRDVKNAKGKIVATGIARVRPFIRHWRQNLRARAPIQSGINDRLPKYGPALGAAVVKGWEADQK